ncbi:MAG: hypothetical protein ABIJ34_05690 [archaeon]
MKESSWNDCMASNNARNISPDIIRAKSLVETSMQRIGLITLINQKNCNFVFEDYYTSIIELIQAMTFKKGFNISNHVCLGYYLRDVLKREDLYLAFDDVRFKRNSLTYYGKRMEYDTAKIAIDKCKLLIREIEKHL